MLKGISIIIPTYNRQELLEEAINSVLAQDYEGELEIIISDDGSSDRTLEVASSFGSRIKILRKPSDCKSQGASGARNRGIIKATQPLICFLDSDDFYLPGHLQRMVTAIQSEPNLGFALCNSLEMINLADEKKFRRWTKKKIEARDMNNLSITTIHFANSNGFIFKSEVYDQIGLFDENFQVGEDSDMWMRINEKFKGVYANHFGTVIRKHEFNQLTDLCKKSLMNVHYTVYRNAIRRYYALNLNDRYRLYALRRLCLKYMVSQWPVFKSIYIFISNRKIKNQTYDAYNDSWCSLESFLEKNSINTKIQVKPLSLDNNN